VLTTVAYSSVTQKAIETVGSVLIVRCWRCRRFYAARKGCSHGIHYVIGRRLLKCFWVFIEIFRYDESEFAPGHSTWNANPYRAFRNPEAIQNPDDVGNAYVFLVALHIGQLRIVDLGDPAKGSHLHALPVLEADRLPLNGQREIDKSGADKELESHVIPSKIAGSVYPQGISGRMDGKDDEAEVPASASLRLLVGRLNHFTERATMQGAPIRLRETRRSDRSRLRISRRLIDALWGIVYLVLQALTQLQRFASRSRNRANILASELRSFRHRIESEPCKRGILVLPLNLTAGAQEQSHSLHNPIPSGTSYIKRLAAERPWMSISDLSLCLESYEVARQYILCSQQSCIERFDARSIHS